jgi:hypothetical protein
MPSGLRGGMLGAASWYAIFLSLLAFTFVTFVSYLLVNLGVLVWKECLSFVLICTTLL